MTVDVLMLMEITSVFVLMDLMVLNVKVTKTECSCFMNNSNFGDVSFTENHYIF